MRPRLLERLSSVQVGAPTRDATAKETPAMRAEARGHTLRRYVGGVGWRGYGVAVLAVGLATLVRWLMDPVFGDLYPFPTFFLAVLLASQYGWGPVILSVGLSVVAMDYWFIPPRGSLQVLGVAEECGVAAFILVGLAAGWVSQAQRKTAEVLRTFTQELEARVSEKTKFLSEANVQMQTILDTASDGIHILTEDGSVVKTNRAFQAMLGYSADELVRLNVSDWDVQWAKEELRTQFRAFQGPEVFTTRHRRRDGTFLDVEISANRVEINGQRLLYAAARDITKRKRDEEALRQTNEALQMIVHTSPLAIFTLNSQGNILFWSPAAEKMFGWTEQDLLGRPYPLVPEGMQSEFQASFAKVLRGESIIGQEVRRQKKDGALIIVRLSAAPLTDSQGTVTGALVVMEDITTHRQFEVHARRVERLAALGQMMAGISHELKNPLFVLTGRLQLVKEKLAHQEYQTLSNDLEKIEGAAKRMTDIVQRFLGLARPLTPRLTPCTIDAILQQTLDFLANELMKNHIRVITAVAPDLPAVLCDPGQLQEVFLNLMLNAMQAMVTAHGQGTLSVRAELADGRIEIRLQDDGPGILPEHQPKLFEPFFTTKSNGEGSGLGLWSVRMIVTGLGGTVECDTAVGQGTTFIVRLPVVGNENAVTS